MYCSTPTNPDVTGIGTRLSMYIQSFLTVVLGYISWSRNRNSTPAILAAARLQTYVLAAFAVATFVATIQDQLSLFHQYAAVQLAILTYASGVFAAVFWGFGGVKWVAITWRLMACGIAIVAFLILLLWSEVDLGCSLFRPSNEGCSSVPSVCIPSPQSPNAGYDQLTWVVLFDVHLRGRLAFLAIPFATVSGGVLILGAFMYGPVKLLLSAFLVFFVHSVVGIERSLRANSIDIGVENVWSFGQIVPIFLLVPTLESIVAEYFRYDVESAAEGQSTKATRWRIVKNAVVSSTVHMRGPPYTCYIINNEGTLTSVSSRQADTPLPLISPSDSDTSGDQGRLVTAKFFPFSNNTESV